jgi:uracil-DNA glycosylase
MTPSQFVNSLKAVKFDDVFNPYSDKCEVCDLENAPKLRTAALMKVLQAAARTGVDAFWIGRDLGYRGGRRTGLALTDDVHLSTHATRWNLRVTRATIGSLVAERTAAVVWNMLSQVPAPIFLWNVFPFHPHMPGDPFSNRAHTRNERDAGEEILAELIGMLRPRRLVAIGNDAARTAERFAQRAEVIHVRHPSYGGQRDFEQQIQSLYDLKAKTDQLTLS